MTEHRSKVGVPGPLDAASITGFNFVEQAVSASDPVDVASLLLSNNLALYSDTDIHVGGELSLANQATLWLSPDAGDLIAGDTVGAGPTTLNDGSQLTVFPASPQVGAREVSFYGNLSVDPTSEIVAAGTVALMDGFQLHGSLTAWLSVLALEDMSGDLQSSIDLDGDETGELRIIHNGAELRVPSHTTDPFSGTVEMVSGATLTFTGQHPLQFDGTLHGGVYNDLDPVTLAGPDATFSEASEVILADAKNVTFNFESLTVDGFIDATNTDLTVNTATPWRLSGHLRNGGGVLNIEGSAMEVGSQTELPAFLDAEEQMVFHVPLVLESSARVLAGNPSPSGSGSSLKFYGPLTLSGPDINSEYGPWAEDEDVRPADFRVFGRLDVNEDTTIYAGTTQFGDPAGNTRTPHRIRVGKTLTIDARSFENEDNVRLSIEPNARLEVTIRSTTEIGWFNDMSIVLDRGQIQTDNFCNRGRIAGRGVITASLWTFYQGIPCDGVIQPEHGALRFSGNPAFSGTMFRIGISGTQGSDYGKVRAQGVLNVFGSALEVSFEDGFEPAVGDSFQLFSAAFIQSLELDTITMDGLPPSLSYNLGQLLATGVLEIVDNP